ncbi:MAG: hypothetical protein KIG65_07435 [Eubacteriales bacterium]|nr:hypothetical protein [Eubacteriales bacterium]
MKKTQKSAFIINECKSPYISQAIFILKDGFSPNHYGVIADAERIVASYMSNSERKISSKKEKLSPMLISVITALITVTICSAIFIMISK